MGTHAHRARPQQAQAQARHTSIQVPEPTGRSRRKSPPNLAGTGSYISTTSSALTTNHLGEEEPLRLDQKAKFSATENFRKRARAKYLTQALSLKLADLKGKLSKSYWNTWHCSTVLQKKGDNLTAKYCKNRWCLVCNRIRTAQLVKEYLPTLQEWERKQFVTLSARNISADQLEAAIKEIKAVFDRIRKEFDNEWRRGKRENPLVGIRKIEVTYNPDHDNYHPHLHLVIRDPEVAHELRERWLYYFAGRASWDGQNVKPADNGSVLELFKYFTKLVSSHARARTIQVAQLDIIFQAVAGQRTYQAYNVRVARETSDEEAEALAEELSTEAVYQWEQSVTDWVNMDTGELLTGFEPALSLRELVERGIQSTPLPPPPKGS